MRTFSRASFLFSLFSFLFICTSAGLYAQSDVSGTVVDSSQVSLPGANIVLLRASDSLLVSFATTNNQGDFLLEDVPVGNYQMHVSFLGYDRNPQTLEVTDEDQFLGLGELVMFPAGYALSGVEVTAGRIPIRMKGDTMMYDAEAFAVGENASVEDLLRRMPGLSIDANGGITWRGQTVQQVLVNGKPFFAGNASLITQNLDAEALTSVEVFDQQSNREELSGVDDGVENTTINLEMKEEFKAKVFGEVEAGYGTSERYRGGAKIFRISDASQFGLLGTINNVNQVGFSSDEMMSFNRSMGQGSYVTFSRGNDGTLPINRGGQAGGQNRSIATGLNYGSTIGKTQLNLSYTLFDREQAQAQQINQAFNGRGDSRETFTQQTDASHSYSHRIDVKVEQDLDSLSRLDFSAAAYIVNNDDSGFSSVAVRDPANGDQDYTVDQNSAQERPAGTIDLEYSRRLGKPGRMLTIESYGSYGVSNQDINILTSGLSEQLVIPGALINGLQNQDRRTEELGIYNSIGYTDPLSDNWILETELSYDLDEEKGDFNFQQEGQTAQNIQDRSWNTIRAGAGLVYRFGERNNLSFRSTYLTGSLNLQGDAMRSTRYNYLVSRLSLRLRSKKGYYSFRLNNSPQVPGISQLQTIAQPGSSGRVSVGNPNLEPAMRYSASGYAWFNDQFRAISFGGNGSLNYIDNAIGNELTFAQGQQIYRPVNVSHSWSTNMNIFSTIGIEAIRGQLSIGGSFNHNRGLGIVDGQNRANISNSVSANASLNTELNEQSYLTFSYEWSRGSNRFDDERADVIQTISHNLSAKLGLEFSPKWRLESFFTYSIYEAAAFTGATDIYDLQLSLEVRPFKEAGHYFKLGAYDIFDQNTIINRQVQTFSTTESTSDALGRFFLLSFHYKL